MVESTGAFCLQKKMPIRLFVVSLYLASDVQFDII